MPNPILKAHLEGVKNFEETFCKVGVGGELPNVAYSKPIIAFLTTYGTNLLKAALEAGPGENNEHWMHHKNEDCEACGFNSCRSSFRQAIDEGIKGIEKGEKHG